MQNPSYLIRSRHAIYYFRYPMPEYGNGRLSISLNTRCPKEALRLSKVLEYHAFMVMSNTDTNALDYIEVKEILRNHFAEVLERMKRTIDKEGELSSEKVTGFLDIQSYALEAIRNQEDELYGVYFSDDEDIPEGLSLDSKLKPIADRNGITNRDSKEYKVMRREYKSALNGYITSLLAYNDDKGFYNYNQSKSETVLSKNTLSDLKLGHVIDEYLKEIQGTMGTRGFRDQRDCVNYLLEVFGRGIPITSIDYGQVRKVKAMLQNTPSNRNKMRETKGLPLLEQLKAKDKHELKTISVTTVNKYLGYMSGLYEWATKNKYVSENPFKGMKIKQSKKQKKRKNFTKEQVLLILNAVSELNTNKPLDKTRYWSAMIAIYTGARLNEVCSLTPDDVKQDKDTGVWYFDIIDEEESKSLKTDAGKRIVPVHPILILYGVIIKLYR